MSDKNNSSLLVIILDTNPIWWGQTNSKSGANSCLSTCLNSVMVFANSHLMFSHSNKLAVIAAHTNKSCFLYPLPKEPVTIDPVVDTENETEENSVKVPQIGQNDGKYELFAQFNETIKSEIQNLIFNDKLEGELYSDSLIAGAMSMALCYIHRMEKEASVGEDVSSRILVIKGSEDNAAQYMNFMNAVFTAQKQNVVIDACILDNDSGLLQQACDITGGMYLKVPQMSGLLQYLLWVFLPDPVMRCKLTLPPKAQVDYRAACFCHRNLIDIGYVCSVCLSIYCSFSPICSTCQTTFKFMGPPKMLKKKSKRLAS
ncbi:general transcription factor IIH subunit 3 [Patella vulgata]|uniref:general transcription factor IIH subunit 3 n=1 Tax=Patella vulgata TaxID=6465 RepID=UPI002180250D|nr:general transcription factor IIH subunit 3 [Patella vulgata]